MYPFLRGWEIPHTCNLGSNYNNWYECVHCCGIVREVYTLISTHTVYWWHMISTSISVVVSILIMLWCGHFIVGRKMELLGFNSLKWGQPYIKGYILTLIELNHYEVTPLIRKFYMPKVERFLPPYFYLHIPHYTEAAEILWLVWSSGDQLIRTQSVMWVKYSILVGKIVTLKGI